MATTVSLATFRGMMDGRLEDVISGTTSAAGATDKTTAVDASLARYSDDSLKGRDLYMTDATEARCIKSNLSPSGTITVWEAFSAQVATSKAYEIHQYSIAKKKAAANKALRDVYSTFYKRLVDTSLYGQNSYGEPDDEFNKYPYTVPAEFYYVPFQIWLIEGYIGQHDGDDDASALTDSSRDWTTNELAGMLLKNKTDGSTATVTSNTDDDVTATLSGGTGNKWDEDDEYIIQRPDRKPILLGREHYVVTDAAYPTALKFWASIGQKYILQLVGAQQLTQFTTDTSTTELTTEHAEVVALKACSILLRRLAASGSSQNRDPLGKLADEFDQEYYWQIKQDGKHMPVIDQKMRIDFSWAQR